MATRRWIGNAVNIAQVDTVTIASTWATADVCTLTINGNDLVVTIGTDATTAQVALAIQEAWESTAQTGTGDHTFSPTGGGTTIGEFSRITATVSGSVVTLTADNPGVPFVLSVVETTAGSGTATEATATAATGKWFYNNVDNWDIGTTPADNDAVVFDSGDVDCLYGLDTIAHQPASFTRKASYDGKIGLPQLNVDNSALPYNEYRTTHLTFDNNSVTCAVLLESSGGRTRIDFGAGQTTVTVNGKAQRENRLVPEILLLGSHAANILTVTKGDVGFGFYGEASDAATLNIGWLTNQAGDASLICGTGLTAAIDVVKDGGYLETASALGTVTHAGGDMLHRGAVVITALTVRGGHVQYNSTGTLATATVSGDGHLDFSGDLQAKTVTNPVEIYGPNAKFSDPNNLVGSLVLDLNETANTKNLVLGTNIRLTRGAVA